jgi:hypothetical protein
MGDLTGNAISLIVARGIEYDSYRLAWLGCRDEPFRHAACIVGNEPVGCAQNIGGASVIVLERDNRSGWIIALKLQDITDARASPAVDCLVWIARYG